MLGNLLVSCTWKNNIIFTVITIFACIAFCVSLKKTHLQSSNGGSVAPLQRADASKDQPISFHFLSMEVLCVTDEHLSHGTVTEGSGDYLEAVSKHPYFSLVLCFSLVQYCSAVSVPARFSFQFHSLTL